MDSPALSTKETSIMSDRHRGSESTADSETESAVLRAGALALTGDDAAAMDAYLEAVRVDPTNFEALNELGTLALSRGFRSAARTAYRQAVRCHPANPIGRINLANVLVEDGQSLEARQHYQAALDVDPDFPEAHQGLGRAFAAVGDDRAAQHWQQGFAGHSIVERGYRGIGPAIPVLLLATVRLGNMPTQHWVDDRLFAVTVIHVEFWNAEPLPPHALIVNAIGDADLCGEALARARALIDGVRTPIINLPACVAATGRAENARRLAALSGVITPDIVNFTRADSSRVDHFEFPLLLRSPGFHTGQHFVRVESRASLADSIETLPGDELMAIQYLDARGRDGMARKFRVMSIDGTILPLHLAISKDWKVHYFSAAMANEESYRDEERRFLEDMPGALGERAMAALQNIVVAIGLDYFGIDFALAGDGSVMLFEVNATMIVIAPPPEAIWDYRRRAVSDILVAAKRMILARVSRR